MMKLLIELINNILYLLIKFREPHKGVRLMFVFSTIKMCTEIKMASNRAIKLNDFSNLVIGA